MKLSIFGKNITENSMYPSELSARLFKRKLLQTVNSNEVLGKMWTEKANAWQGQMKDAPYPLKVHNQIGDIHEYFQ